MPKLTWNRRHVIDALKRMHRRGAELSYNALARREQSLVSAAAYHFGSYRAAITAAGIDYQEISRRPRWTRQRIIHLLQQAHKNGVELSWSAITQRGDELSKAAFASLQRRLFGTWANALRSAGLLIHRVSPYRKWNQKSVIAALRQAASRKTQLNSGALQRSDPGLHAAAVRLFGRYDDALAAARLDPVTHRQRHRWTRQRVLTELSALRQISSGQLRETHPALYGAALREFGSLAKARRAAQGLSDAPRAQKRKRKS